MESSWMTFMTHTQNRLILSAFIKKAIQDLFLIRNMCVFNEVFLPWNLLPFLNIQKLTQLSDFKKKE